MRAWPLILALTTAAALDGGGVPPQRSSLNVSLAWVTTLRSSNDHLVRVLNSTTVAVIEADTQVTLLRTRDGSQICTSVALAFAFVHVEVFAPLAWLVFALANGTLLALPPCDATPVWRFVPERELRIRALATNRRFVVIGSDAASGGGDPSSARLTTFDSLRSWQRRDATPGAFVATVTATYDESEEDRMFATVFGDGGILDQWIVVLNLTTGALDKAPIERSSFSPTFLSPVAMFSTDLLVAQELQALDVHEVVLRAYIVARRASPPQFVALPVTWSAYLTQRFAVTPNLVFVASGPALVVVARNASAAAAATCQVVTRTQLETIVDVRASAVGGWVAAASKKREGTVSPPGTTVTLWRVPSL